MVEKSFSRATNSTADELLSALAVKESNFICYIIQFVAIHLMHFYMTFTLMPTSNIITDSQHVTQNVFSLFYRHMRYTVLKVS
jgi:hypothetical protein